MSDFVPQALGPAVPMSNQPQMTEQERLEKCNQELIALLDKYGCELKGLPVSRAEGSILLVEGIPQLSIRRH